MLASATAPAKLPAPKPPACSGVFVTLSTSPRIVTSRTGLALVPSRLMIDSITGATAWARAMSSPGIGQ